ncbi:MAG: pantoate--beta-alanine ligase [Acidobacteriaceae bacterium]|nr:pantoate--beta-alanine ligase [Acidobacteriaceae bacterium]
MQIVHSIAEMRRLRRALPGTLGLVPTMGALHAGHLSLVRAAKQACDHVAVTLFVNPLQFGPKEDFGKYPRTFEQDCALLEAEGVELLFAPAVEEMYPGGAETTVDVPEVGSRLDGASRPGHFRGVSTVVSKLFLIATPDRAYFGQKDAAQVAVLRTMVRDLNFGLELVVCPTVRDADGLAMSSRNRYLSDEERRIALAIPRALASAKAIATQGEWSAPVLEKLLTETLSEVSGLQLDYAAVVDPVSLLPLASVTQGALLAVAAFVGTTRLIDNELLSAEEFTESTTAVLNLAEVLSR